LACGLPCGLRCYMAGNFARSLAGGLRCYLACGLAGGFRCYLASNLAGGFAGHLGSHLAHCFLGRAAGSVDRVHLIDHTQRGLRCLFVALFLGRWGTPARGSCFLLTIALCWLCWFAFSLAGSSTPSRPCLTILCRLFCQLSSHSGRKLMIGAFHSRGLGSNL
jgi:hypothetical protein